MKSFQQKGRKADGAVNVGKGLADVMMMTGDPSELMMMTPRQKIVARQSIGSIQSSSTSSSSSSSSPSIETSWGQQCSPNCGCVVRLESKVEMSTQTIVASSYVAKSIVTVTNPQTGQLVPLKTNRTSKLMFQPCRCETIHRLSQEITKYLPFKSLEMVRNMTEFPSMRSSVAFRHSVLADHGLPRTSTHCFDVLEEAFTAMIKGYMPRARKCQEPYIKLLARTFRTESSEPAAAAAAAHGVAESSSGDDSFGTVSVLPFWTSKTGSSFMESSYKQHPLSFSPGAMSTLNMFDINTESWEYEQQQNRLYEQQRQQQKWKNSTNKSYYQDWVSYVDGQYQNSESA